MGQKHSEMTASKFLILTLSVLVFISDLHSDVCEFPRMWLYDLSYTLTAQRRPQPKKLQKAQWLLEIDTSIDNIKTDPEEAAEMKSLFSQSFCRLEQHDSFFGLRWIA